MADPNPSAFDERQPSRRVYDSIEEARAAWQPPANDSAVAREELAASFAQWKKAAIEQLASGHGNSSELLEARVHKTVAEAMADWHLPAEDAVEVTAEAARQLENWRSAVVREFAGALSADLQLQEAIERWYKPTTRNTPRQ